MSTGQTEDIRIYLQRLKVALGVRSDEQLAGKLGYSKQTIASWRKREKLPVDAEMRIVDAFGPEYAYSDGLRFISSSRENETVHAAALFVCERFITSIGGQPSLQTRRALGYLFPEIVSALRREVREIGFEQENSLTMIEILMALIATDQIPQITKIVKRAASTLEKSAK